MDPTELDGIEGFYGLTGTQKGILFHSLVDKTSSAEKIAPYQNQIGLFVNGHWDFLVFERSLKAIIQRHSIFRTLFLHEGLDEPASVVKSEVEFDVQFVDYAQDDGSGVSLEERLRVLSEHLQCEPIALDSAPLMRVTCVHTAEHQHYLLFDYHHLVFDGWSSVVFFYELKKHYAEILNQRPAVLPPAASYQRYVDWNLKQDQLEAQNFWRQKLQGAVLPTPLPMRQAAAVLGNDTLIANSRFDRWLDQELSNALNTVASANRITLNTIMASAWALCLSRYSGFDETVFGITVNGRRQTLAEHEKTIGLFVNTLPIRVNCDSTQSVSDWMNQVQNEFSEISQFESTSLSEVRQVTELEAGSDLFHSLLVFQSFPDLYSDDEASVEHLPWKFSDTRIHENSPLPLTIEVFDGEQLRLLALYSDERFSHEFIEQMLGHLTAILQSIAELPGLNGCVKNIRMISEAEEMMECSPYSLSTAYQVDNETVYEQFLNAARKTPHTIAVYDNQGSVTYQQLWAQSVYLSNQLNSKGVLPGEPVACYMNRACGVYAVILGVLRSRAMVLLLDGGWPIARVENYIQSCGVKLTLTDARTRSEFAVLPAEQWCISDKVLSEATQANCCSSEPVGLQDTDPMYLMFTSGSSGRSKPVIGSQRAALNRINWMWHQYPYTANDVCCQKSALCFVDSIAEMFCPLLAGVPTVVVSDETLNNPFPCLRQLHDRQVTRLLMVPSILAVFMDEIGREPQLFKHLTHCFVSGERMPPSLAEQFITLAPHCKLVNLYGSTEVAGDVSFHEISPANIETSAAIGRPINGCGLHILNGALQPMPLGAVGELYVSGIGINAGYYNNLEMTHQTFLTNPFADGQLYRTGDLASRTKDGLVHLQGRADGQIKRRGVRIHPAEINDLLMQQADVQLAVTRLVDQNRLCSWVQSAAAETADEARLTKRCFEELVKVLPSSMCPDSITVLPTLPRLPSGKIDYQALPVSSVLSNHSNNDASVISTETEKTLAGIWQEILPKNKPHKRSRFVESGGNSLTAMQLNARVYRHFNQSINPRMLLLADFEQIARYLDGSEELPAHPEEVGSRTAVSASTRTVNIEPVFFPSGKESLYGMLHRPLQETADVAVLMCSSISHEYMKLHPLIRSSANGIAERGYPVMRFDFTGFGDSTGETDRVTLKHWTADVEAAANYLLEISGKTKLILVGARLGVPIMLRAKLESLCHVVALDPVILGSAFVDHLDELHEFALSDLDRYRSKQRHSDPLERFGYLYSDRLLQDIRELRCDLNTVPAHVRLDILCTSFFAEHDGSGRRDGEFEVIERPHTFRNTINSDSTARIWSNLEAAQTVLLNHDVVQSLVDSVIEV